MSTLRPVTRQMTSKQRPGTSGRVKMPAKRPVSLTSSGSASPTRDFELSSREEGTFLFPLLCTLISCACSSFIAMKKYMHVALKKKKKKTRSAPSPLAEQTTFEDYLMVCLQGMV